MKINKAIKKFISIVCSLVIVASTIVYSPTIATSADEIQFEGDPTKGVSTATTVAYFSKNRPVAIDGGFVGFRTMGQGDNGDAWGRIKGTEALYGEPVFVFTGGDKDKLEILKGDKVVLSETSTTKSCDTENAWWLGDCTAINQDVLALDEGETSAIFTVNVTNNSVVKTFYLKVKVFDPNAEANLKAKMQTEANIAVGKDTIESSNAGGQYLAKNVNDNNHGSRWAAGTTSEGEYVGVNLGAVYEISSVGLIWEGAYASQYNIEVSLNGTDFTTVAQVEASKASTKEIEFEPVEAQIVRVYIVKAGTQWNPSIYELGVFGTYVREGITIDKVLNTDAKMKQTEFGQAKGQPNVKFEWFQIDNAKSYKLIGVDEGSNKQVFSIPLGENATDKWYVDSDYKAEDAGQTYTVTLHAYDADGNEMEISNNTITGVKMYYIDTDIYLDEYASINWVPVTNATDVYVAAGGNEFPITATRLPDGRISINPTVDAGTKPIWPGFGAPTLNGDEINGYDNGAAIYVPETSLNENAINVINGTSSVQVHEFTILVKMGSVSAVSNTFVSGWFTDDTFTVPCEATATGAVAKNTKSDVIKVKAQITEDASKIRFVSSVDSLFYQEAGFKVSGTYDGKALKQKKVVNTNVYSEIYEGGVKKSAAAAMGVDESEYCFTFAVGGLASGKTSEWTVTPYVKRLDGIRVIGETKTFTIDENGSVSVK